MSDSPGGSEGRSFSTKVVDCARCRGKHSLVVFKPLDCPGAGWTHYGLCPANNQPIMCRTGGVHTEEDDQPLYTKQEVSVSPDQNSSLPPPDLTLTDQLAELVKWDGNGLLLDAVRDALGPDKDALRKLAEKVHEEGLRLRNQGTNHVLFPLVTQMLEAIDQ